MRLRWYAFPLALALLVSACFGGGPPKPVQQMTDAEYLRWRELMVPVQGFSRRQLRDTYSAPRSGGRAHLALDVMARKGTRVLSADDGTVLRVTENALGGKVVYVVDPHGRFVHYYAHLDKWVYPLREGQSVKRGELLGSVGTTGNAPKDAPHLHYQLMRITDPKRPWEGPPVNPLPYLTKKGDER